MEPKLVTKKSLDQSLPLDFCLRENGLTRRRVAHWLSVCPWEWGATQAKEDSAADLSRGPAG